MAHKVCHDIGGWVSSNIQQSLEQCINQDCNWWCLCCNKWFCFIVWVIVTVVTWVVQTVCEIVADVIDVIVNVVKGIVDILAGIFTWDGTRVAAGLGEIFGSGVDFAANLIPIATGGTLVGAFADERNTWRLRDYAQGLLEDRYKDTDPAGLAAMLDALGINSGGFGLRLKVRALRTFIRSDFSSQTDGTPDLIVWLRNGTLNVDLKSLAGFNPPAWWSRNWPELIGDAGDVSDADLDNYVAKGGRGDDVKQFTLFCMSNSDLQIRLDCGTQHATEIGLMLDWTIEDVRLTRGEQVLVDTGRFATLLEEEPYSRHNAKDDAAAATSELCSPIAIAVFGFQDTHLGISAHLANATCLEAEPDGGTTFVGEGITGVAFRNRRPDIAFKYTAIHELGHTFGLCHVDGLLRIMYTNAAEEQKSASSSSSWWQYWTSGTEAGFTLDEGKKVWEYVVRNFSADCLKTRQF